MKKGNHTWDIIFYYHLCPSCSYVYESRQDYGFSRGKWCKEEECPRCSCRFLVEKKRKQGVFPLTQNGQPIEFEWGK